MESQINQMRDTRERIEIKHLKFSDIAQREFDKIMPNDLTQTFSKSVPRNIGRNHTRNLNDSIGDDDQLSSMD